MKKTLFLLPAALAAFLSDEVQGQAVVSTAPSSGVLPALFQSYPVLFSGTSQVLRADLGQNKASLEAIAEKIASNRAALENGEYRLRVASNIAPVDITPEQARIRARKRALVLKSYLIKTAGAREEFFSTNVTTEGKIAANDRLTVGLVPVGKNDGDNTAIQAEAK